MLTGTIGTDLVFPSLLSLDTPAQHKSCCIFFSLSNTERDPLSAFFFSPPLWCALIPYKSNFYLHMDSSALPKPLITHKDLATPQDSTMPHRPPTSPFINTISDESVSFLMLL